jgi:DNA-binding transcriptional ArsR family regulator
MQLWKTCRAINNEIRLAMLREIARSPNRELNVLQAGDFVGLKKAAASQYLKQLAEAGFLTVERTGKFVVCSGKAQDGTAASRIAKALEAAFPAKARSGWQAALLTAINAFAHHVRLRIVRAVAAAGHVGFEGLAKATGLPPATLRRQLGVLIEAGVVAAGEDGDGLRDYFLDRSDVPLVRVLLDLAQDEDGTL